MTNQSIYRRHAELVDRMANTLGLDLEELIMAGQLSVDAVGDAVLSCTGCSSVEGCEHWLAMQKGVAPESPGICRNGELFSMLKAGKTV